MFWHHELTPKHSWLFQGTTNEKSLSCVFQWRVLTCILWSGSSPAVWWWWSVCTCRGEWTSIILRKVQRFATTATPTTSSPSGSTGRYEQGTYLEVKVFLLLGCRACVYLLFLLCLCQSDWWCVWRSLFISTISKIWSYSRPCSTHPPTSQVQWEGCLCLNWVNYYHILGYCSSLVHNVITCWPAVIVGGLKDEKQNAASLASSGVLQAFVRSLSTTVIPTWHTLAVPP